MNYNVAVKAINQYGNIRVTGYTWLELARVLSQTHNVKARWLDYRKDDKSYGLPDINVEKTFDSCVAACLSTKKESLQLVITISNGDSLDGYVTGVRCEFELILNALPKEFEFHINQRIQTIAREVVKKEDAKIYQDRINGAYATLLKQLATGE